MALVTKFLVRRTAKAVFYLIRVLIMHVYGVLSKYLRHLRFVMRQNSMIVDRSQRIPLTIKNMPRSGTLLDVGCGGVKHTTFDLVSATGDYDLIIGIDAHEPSIIERTAWAASRKDSGRFKFIHGEIQNMKFDRTFDVILLSHIMEHLTLNEAENVLNYLWKICDKQMIVETPNKFENGRSAVAEYKNPYQRHKCLVDEKFMLHHGFVKIFTYFQESGFSNSVYNKEKKQ